MFKVPILRRNFSSIPLNPFLLAFFNTCQVFLNPESSHSGYIRIGKEGAISNYLNFDFTLKGSLFVSAFIDSIDCVHDCLI